MLWKNHGTEGANEQETDMGPCNNEKEQMTKEHFDKMLDGWCDFEYCQNDALNTFLGINYRYVENSFPSIRPGKAGI